MNIVLLFIFASALVACSPSNNKRQAALLSAQGSDAMRNQDFSAAFAAFSEATAKAPNVPEYLIGRGMAAAKLGKFKEAYSDYKKAKLLLETEAAIDQERIDDYAMVLTLLAKNAEAKTILQNGSSKFPESQNLRTLHDNYSEFAASFSDYAVKTEQGAAANP